MTIEAVIGLEVHAQLQTQTKAFCACPISFGATPNTLICPVCTGQPGALPVLNEAVVSMAIRTGLMVGCSIQSRSLFARKHYFYPDLPKGYQISQYEHPICIGGRVLMEGEGGAQKTIALERIHIEEDAGQLVHHGVDGGSGVDFNRCGIPLLEIVTLPVMHSADEAVLFLRTLRDILRYLGVCSGEMQEGAFRCDVNVSVRRLGDTSLGPRTEIKNMNSFRFIHDALTFEIQRQTEMLTQGSAMQPETRTWDVQKKQTLVMRQKETARDYRYFSEPDLPPLVVSSQQVDTLRTTLPELPLVRRKRLIEQCGLPAQSADVLYSNRVLADYFEACAAIAPSPLKASHWILRDLQQACNSNHCAIDDVLVRPEELGQLLLMLEEGVIHRQQAQQIFAVLFQEGGQAREVRERLGFHVVQEHGVLESMIAEVLGEQNAIVERVRAGESKLFGFLMGCVRDKAAGQADMKQISQLLRKALDL